MYRKINFGVLVVLFLISTVFVYDIGHTHSGRTDANGGHYNRRTGEYHYHSGPKSRSQVGVNPTPPQNSGGVWGATSPAQASAPNQGQLTIQQQAIFDAHLDTQQHVSALNWFLGGAGCGVITFAYAVVDTPQVPAARLIGKSPAYIAFYTTEYQSKAKTKRITNSCLGWGTFVLLYFAYLGSSGGY